MSMFGVKLYNSWYLDGMNVICFLILREKKNWEGGGFGSLINIRRCMVGNNKVWWMVFERYRFMYVIVCGVNCCIVLF